MCVRIHINSWDGLYYTQVPFSFNSLYLENICTHTAYFTVCVHMSFYTRGTVPRDDRQTDLVQGYCGIGLYVLEMYV